jgi:SAM-dependent methyltransferase
MAADHWFEEVANHLGPAYLRYSFTKGTANEVAFLTDVLGLEPGARILDVGCGPGRHARALAASGFEVVGIDISQRFVDLASEGAPPGATFERIDARALDFDREFDAVISLCQGAFGLVGNGPGAEPDTTPVDPDGVVLSGIARALKPGGMVALSAFSAYFMVRWLDDNDTFDVARGVNHEHTEVRDAAGQVAPAELWTSCFTPRELRLLAALAGLDVVAIHGVTPGDYAERPPDLEHPEFLLVARRP